MGAIPSVVKGGLRQSGVSLNFVEGKKLRPKLPTVHVI